MSDDNILDPLPRKLLPRELLPPKPTMDTKAYGLPQVNDGRYPLDNLLAQHAAEGRTNFLRPEMEDRIRELCHMDHRIDTFWQMVTNRVRRGLNDEIVSGMFHALGRLLNECDHDMEIARNRGATEMATLRHACKDALAAFEAAKDRGDVIYMVEAMEEVDAALFDIEEREENQHRG